MSKILVVYGTRTGCTEGVADKIGETLSGLGADVEIHSADAKPDSSTYDAVVVGSGARAGNWHGAAKRFLRNNAADLKTKPVALFTVGLTTAAEPEKADEVRAYTDKILAETGIEPVDIGTFAGWFISEKFGMVGRTILTKMKAEEGDFRDWEAIAAWSVKIAPELGVS